MSNQHPHTIKSSPITQPSPGRPHPLSPSLTPQLTHYAEGNQWPGLCSIAQDLYKILLGQDLVQRFVRNLSTRLMISCWLAFSLIIGAAYRSNLTTYLTVPKEPPKIETIQELVGSVDRLVVRCNEEDRNVGEAGDDDSNNH